MSQINILNWNLSLSTGGAQPQQNKKKGNHNRTASVAGVVAKKVNAMLKPKGDDSTTDDAAVMGLIGEDDNQQLDIPIFRTEEGRYLATGAEY